MPDNSDFRIISRDIPNGGRLIAAVKNTDDPEQATDEEILDRLEELGRERRLRAVDDPE